MKSTKIYLILFTLFILIACNPKTTEQILTEEPLTEEVIPEPVAPVIKPLPSLKEKDVLLVHGGWQGHKPKEYTEKIAIFLREARATVTISPSTAVYEDSTFLSSFDLIIQSVTMDKISKAGIKGLLTAIKTGKTLSLIHI